MHQPITTTTCYDCGKLMEGHVQNYKYVESGLTSVVLKNILVFRCTHCGAVVPQITAAAALHSFIAMNLLRKETRLLGEEVRFLRKAVGYSATELATMVGTSKAIVSRWENHSTLSQESDRLVRLICVNKMLRDSFAPSDHPQVDQKIIAGVQELLGFMDDTLKKLRSKRSSKRQQYMIDPAELSNYGTSVSRKLDREFAVQ